MTYLWVFLFILWIILGFNFAIRYREWKDWDEQRRAELRGEELNGDKDSPE